MEVRRIRKETTLADTSALQIMAWRGILHDLFRWVHLRSLCVLWDTCYVLPSDVR